RDIPPQARSRQRPAVRYLQGACRRLACSKTDFGNHVRAESRPLLFSICLEQIIHLAFGNDLPHQSQQTLRGDTERAGPVLDRAIMRKDVVLGVVRHLTCSDTKPRASRARGSSADVEAIEYGGRGAANLPSTRTVDGRSCDGRVGSIER